MKLYIWAEPHHSGPARPLSAHAQPSSLAPTPWSHGAVALAYRRPLARGSHCPLNQSVFARPARSVVSMTRGPYLVSFLSVNNPPPRTQREAADFNALEANNEPNIFLHNLDIV